MTVLEELDAKNITYAVGSNDVKLASFGSYDREMWVMVMAGQELTLPKKFNFEPTLTNYPIVEYTLKKKDIQWFKSNIQNFTETRFKTGKIYEIKGKPFKKH